MPSDIEAERRVLGAVLLNPNLLDEVANLVEPADFVNRPYAMALTAAIELRVESAPINAQTVIRRLGEMRMQSGTSVLQDIGGGDMVVSAVVGVAPEEAEFWAQRVVKKRRERELLEFGKWIASQASSDPSDISGLQAKAEEKLLGLGSGAHSPTVVSGSNALDELRSRVDRYISQPDEITGLATGWRLFDVLMDGLQPGNVTVLYAPSSRYKSFVATNIGWRLARQGIPGLWYTTEMPMHQVQERVLQLETGLNLKWLRRAGTIGSHSQEIRRGVDQMSYLPIFYCDRSEMDIGTLQSEILRQKRWNSIQYVIVDLVDMVTSSTYRDNEVGNTSVVMRKMKSVAKSAGVHIILVSHISKTDGSLRNAASLDPEEMKGSSSKYQDVDAAISIMPVTIDPSSGEWVGLTRRSIAAKVASEGVLTLLLAITKNRHGELAELPFVIDLNAGGRLSATSREEWVQSTFALEDEEEEE